MMQRMLFIFVSLFTLVIVNNFGSVSLWYFDVIIIVLLKGFRYVITFLHYRKSILKSILELAEEKGNEKKFSK